MSKKIKTISLSREFRPNVALAIISGILLCLTLLLAIIGRSNGIIYANTNGSAMESATAFYDDMISGYYPDAISYLDDLNQIDSDIQSLTDEERLYISLLRKSYKYSLSEEQSSLFSSKINVSFTYFDFSTLASPIAEKADKLLNEKVETMEEADLYNEDGSYKTEVLDEVYETALKNTISEIFTEEDYSKYTLTTVYDITCNYTDGKWLITPNDAMISGFTGGTGNTANISSKVLKLYEGFSTLCESDKSSVLSQYSSDIHEFHTVYKIGSEVPTPDPACYGTASGEEMLGIIEQARECGLLSEDEQMVFNTNVNFIGSSGIQYYFDETILVIMWKEMIEGHNMTFSEIKVGDISQFRRKLAGDTYGSSEQYFCSQLTNQVNSVVSMNADFYAFRNLGITVYEGKVHRVDQTLDTLFIDGNGDFLYYDRGTPTSEAELQKFVDDNNVSFSLSFGPIMVRDGVLQDLGSYPIGEGTTPYSRTCLCQVDTLHYLFANAGYLSEENRGCTSAELAQYVYNKGVKQAYMMDGGQTSEIIFNNNIFNYLSYGDERTVSDIIYFSTALPEDKRGTQ